MGIKLGDVVRDKVTGFSGTVTVRAQYISAANRAGVESCGPDGKLQDNWFDESRLEVIEPATA